VQSEVIHIPYVDDVQFEGPRDMNMHVLSGHVYPQSDAYAVMVTPPQMEMNLKIQSQILPQQITHQPYLQAHDRKLQMETQKQVEISPSLLYEWDEFFDQDEMIPSFFPENLEEDMWSLF